ncbi:malate synthase G [Alteromonas sp. C1M14]|uniref:malate synthase G n=1 Tax=Alteromonas sp. C1M14 TaxID=2841567 RepID=UPI001C0A0997|nr:malate synthase G [Alteromonas sp. C1M14]MBU2979189.1 malate synthase G [Alteromonas sp. C1M14]
MKGYIQHGRLQVAEVLDSFINTQALPGTHVAPAAFWQAFEALLIDLTPQNKALLEKRDSLQAQIDRYHQASKSPTGDEYLAFLKEIGYLQPQPEEVVATTENVDAEIATMAGPQLVVPINNARYALNAANARWGSLYDALYGTDVISDDGGAEAGKTYNPARGAKVIAKSKEWLDIMLPLANGFHSQVKGYELQGSQLLARLSDSQTSPLKSPEQFVGYQGSAAAPTSLFCCHNGLHFELQIDATDPIGSSDPASVKDIVLEAALTTIMDCEDSVAAVDAEDKTLVYANWLGLMTGDLTLTMEKNGRKITRAMQQDKQFISAADPAQTVTLSGRSLMFVRNVGHLMTNDAILLDDAPVYEGLMDGVITALIGKHDVLGNGKYKNSQKGSIYIVKPKMHGPEEVAFTDTLFARIETMLDLPTDTLKMGIMDEERRTSINLKACIGAASSRVAFINTGFLDRTGDEIHTSMYAGPFAPKGDLKAMAWIQAYEKANVVTGLQCGLSGRAQIGKGMWAIPDQMANMMEVKVGHPMAGANTAWVPSPTAATLHSLHYHDVDVFGIQRAMGNTPFDGTKEILTIPLLSDPSTLSETQIQREVDNNVQGILGYVVRWVHQGIGCSKVPDINNVGLMEDRATLRISSQHLANWLLHDIISHDQVMQSLETMAVLVDKQNEGDADYIPMTPNLADSFGFQAAKALIFEGVSQPNGYTEPLLHQKRREMKTAV